MGGVNGGRNVRRVNKADAQTDLLADRKLKKVGMAEARWSEAARAGERLESRGLDDEMATDLLGDVDAHVANLIHFYCSYSLSFLLFSAKSQRLSCLICTLFCAVRLCEQVLGCVLEVILRKRGNEIVAMIIVRLHSQLDIFVCVS